MSEIDWDASEDLDANFREAQRRIEQARKERATLLDLGDLQLAEFPEELRQLTALEHLSLGWRELRLNGDSVKWKFRDGRYRHSRPSDIGVLSKLTSLRTLDLSGFRDLRDVTPLANLTNLQSLDLSGCQQLTDPTPLAKLTNLQSLDLRGCVSVTDLTSLAKLTNLQSLELSECQQLTNLAPLANLTNLQTLDLSFCPQLRDLTPLANLPKLRSLSLYGCWQLTDFTPLTNLRNLQSLDLGDCEQASNLAALANLTNLQSLDLNACKRVTDLGPLVNLTNLVSLDLYECYQPTDIRPLQHLTNLQSLQLGCGLRLSDLGPLAELKNLNNLRLIFTERPFDLEPLAGLCNLVSLELARCGDATDFGSLRSLPSLETLRLIDCSARTDFRFLDGLTQLKSLTMTGCLHLIDVKPLGKLTSLTSLSLDRCERLSELEPLSALRDLQELDIWSAWLVTDVRPLAELTNMQSLRLNSCEHVADLTPLAKLKKLKTLDLSDCTSIRQLTPLSGLLGSLNELHLYGCQFDDLPAELYGKKHGENVIDAVRAHFADLETQASDDVELKVCLLGNGSVGKTQLCRRLRGQDFDPSIPTTHGIELGHLNTTFDGRKVRLNLWDFGGQDIYHGSHALFLQGPAIFLILWTPDTEMGQYNDGDEELPHHPLAYWLDYVRGLAGADAPVLVIQSQCDTTGQRQRSPAVSRELSTQHASSDEDANVPDNGNSGNTFRYLRELSVSSKTSLGLQVLKGELEDAVRDLLTRQPPPPIGAGRVEVRNTLRKRLETDQRRAPEKRKHRTLSLRQFRTLCTENGKVSSADALLEYLHRTGVVFYQQGMFDDRIILDQTWALDAIYALFDREQTWPVLNRHGRFTREDLERLVWSNYAVQDQELFLRMMESCGICFHLRKLKPHDDQPVIWEYVAPELLPEWSAAQDLLVGRMLGGPHAADVRVEYRFLHEGILRGFLSKLGRQAGDAAVYWKYGCWFYEEETASQVLIRGEMSGETGHGCVTLDAVSEQPQELLERVLEQLLSIPIGQPPTVVRSWVEPTGVSSASFSRDRATHSSPLSHRRGAADRESRAEVTEESVVSMGTRADARQFRVSKSPDIPATGKPQVAVSYAWGDDSESGRKRTATVDGLCHKMPEWGYEVVRDCDALRNGDLLSAFMMGIGRSDHVVVILSEKYLHSPNCMSELFYIYHRSQGQKEDFLKRVIPVVLDDAREITNWRGRARYAKHWEDEYRDMEPYLNVLGRDDLDRYRLIKQWYAVIGDILGFISDTLHPHGFDAIVKDDFAAVRDMLPPVSPRD